MRTTTSFLAEDPQRKGRAYVHPLRRHRLVGSARAPRALRNQEAAPPVPPSRLHSSNPPLVGGAITTVPAIMTIINLPKSEWKAWLASEGNSDNGLDEGESALAVTEAGSFRAAIPEWAQGMTGQSAAHRRSA